MSTMEGFVFPQGKKIYYKIINTQFRSEGRPVLVFLHEGLGSVAQWRDFPEELSTSTKCAALLYDRYGYGQSEACEGVRAETFLEDEAFAFLPEILRQTGIKENIILIGHSDGGTIALLYASAAHDNLLGVITEADHVLCEPITVQGVKDVGRLYEEGLLKKLLLRFHGGNTETMFRAWHTYWSAQHRAAWSITNVLGNVKCPVLAIQGKNDNYGSVLQLTEKLKHLGGQTEALFIPDCGHIPHAESADTVKAKMTAFISGLLLRC